MLGLGNHRWLRLRWLLGWRRDVATRLQAGRTCPNRRLVSSREERRNQRLGGRRLGVSRSLPSTFLWNGLDVPSGRALRAARHPGGTSHVLQGHRRGLAARVMGRHGSSLRCSSGATADHQLIRMVVSLIIMPSIFLLLMFMID